MTPQRHDDATAPEYLRLNEARALLGISPGTMTALLANGRLVAVPDAVDRRLKLVKRSDVEALAARTRHERRQRQSA